MIAPLILGGLSALGGIFGHRKRKYLDPQMYNQLYGAQAMGKRTQELVNQIVNSPYGQTLMAQAGQQGQALQTGLEGAAARSGFGPAGGASSGASDFSVAAAPQATNALQRGVTSDITRSAMPIAQGMVNREGELALANLADQNAQPTLMGRIGQAASGAMSGMTSGNVDWADMLKKLQAGGTGAEATPIWQQAADTLRTTAVR
jgi:hypothetical protein